MTGAAALYATITVLLNGGAQLLLRKAALSGASPGSPVSLLTNAWFITGIAAYGVSVLTWLYVLRRVPLAVAAPFVAMVYVVVPVASRMIFGDEIQPRMWVGMLLVVAGVTLVAQGPATSPPNETATESE